MLEAISAQPLGAELCFKSGNALRFVYGNRRSTVDLDFSATPQFPRDPAVVKDLLDRAVRATAAQHGIRMRCHSVKQKPPAAESRHPTLEARIPFLFPGDFRFEDFDSLRQISPVAKVEIAINDVICNTSTASLGTAYDIRVRTCTL